MPDLVENSIEEIEAGGPITKSFVGPPVTVEDKEVLDLDAHRAESTKGRAVTKAKGQPQRSWVKKKWRGTAS